MKQKYLRSLSFIISLIIIALPALPADASSLSTNTRVTANIETSTDAVWDNWPEQSQTNTLSDNGRYTVYTSTDSHLVPGDTNNVADVFVYDRLAKKTDRISVSDTGQQANGASHYATISADGRYIAYVTQATNVVTDTHCTTRNCSLVVVRDRQTHKTITASLNAAGQPMVVNLYGEPRSLPATISADGLHVVFSSIDPYAPSDFTQQPTIFVRNLSNHTTQVASLGSNNQRPPSGAWQGSISGDGRYVVFVTSSRFIPDDDNTADDVYMRDLTLGKTTLVSRAFNGGVTYTGFRESYSPAISDNGKFVVFASESDDLVPGDYSGHTDIFLRDLQANHTTRVTTAKFGSQPNGHSYAPDISSDGSYIVFNSAAKNLTRDAPTFWSNTFIYYRQNVLTKRLVLPTSSSLQYTSADAPHISGDGTVITYQAATYGANSTWAENLYLNYDPVAANPYYDPSDILNLF